MSRNIREKIQGSGIVHPDNVETNETSIVGAVFRINYFKDLLISTDSIAVVKMIVKAERSPVARWLPLLFCNSNNGSLIEITKKILLKVN